MTKVNAENIRKVISMIEKEQNHFDMKKWVATDEEGFKIKCHEDVCGTPSCIGGWAEAIMLRESGLPSTSFINVTPMYVVGRWLGLTPTDADALFYPPEERDEYGNLETSSAYNATRQEAIAHLNHIIKTGEVNWSKFA